MRHQMKNQRFDRPTDARLALFRGLVTELLKHEFVVTKDTHKLNSMSYYNVIRIDTDKCLEILKDMKWMSLNDDMENTEADRLEQAIDRAIEDADSYEQQGAVEGGPGPEADDPAHGGQNGGVGKMARAHPLEA